MRSAGCRASSRPARSVDEASASSASRSRSTSIRAPSKRERADALEGLRLADRDARLRNRVAVPRARRGRRRDRSGTAIAPSLYGGVRNRRLEALRQHDRDAVAGLTPVAASAFARRFELCASWPKLDGPRELAAVSDEDRRSLLRLPVRDLDAEIEDSRQLQRWDARSSRRSAAARSCRGRATRKPMCAERRPGALLLRAAQRMFRAVGLANEPPRRTRGRPDSGSSRPSRGSYGYGA